MLDPAPTRLLNESAVLDCVLSHMHAACRQRVFGVVSGARQPQDGCDHPAPDLEETQSVCQPSRELPPRFEPPIFLGKVIEKVVAAQLSSHL